MAKEQPIEFFMPPNNLKAKLGGTGGGVDTGAIKRAKAALDALSVEFNDWLTDDIAKLALARDGLVNSPSSEMRDDLFRAAHDLKGQAETFGYPFIARMAASLSKLIDEAKPEKPLPRGLIDAHVAGIQIAFRNKIKVATDDTAGALAKEFETRVAEALAG